MKRLIIIISLIILFSYLVFGNPTRKKLTPTVPQEYLAQLKGVRMIRIQSEVILIDYALLKSDFPQLAGQSNESIKRWLLNEASFMRNSQLVENGIACVQDGCIHQPPELFLPITHKTGLVSDLTRRSALVPVSNVPNAYLDVKGSGANKPTAGGLHVNGVLDLRFAISDFIFSKILRGIQRVVPASERFEFVDSYAVLHIPAWFWSEHQHYGFSPDHVPPDVLPRSPANRQDIGLLVRRAVSRPLEKLEYLAPLHWQIKFESLLRRFSLTSTFHYSIWHPTLADQLMYWDAQMDGAHKVFIDFNSVHYLDPQTLLNHAGKPVYHPMYWLNDPSEANHSALACMDFSSGRMNAPLSECIPKILEEQPEWHIPKLNLLPPIYQLGFLRRPWSDLVNDYSPIFADDDQRETYDRLLLEVGLSDLLRSHPTMIQEIFNRLEARLASWPPISSPMYRQFDNTQIL